MAVLDPMGAELIPLVGCRKIFLPERLCQPIATSRTSSSHPRKEQQDHSSIATLELGLVHQLLPLVVLHCSASTLLPITFPAILEIRKHGVDFKRLNECSSDQEPQKQWPHQIRTCQQCHVSCMLPNPPFPISTQSIGLFPPPALICIRKSPIDTTLPG